MVRVQPFQAIRPAEQYAAEIASVPYDVVSRAEAAALARDNPFSFLHVTRAEIDLPADTDPYSDAVHNRALLNFQKLQEQSSLVRETEPHFYLYRLTYANHIQDGICACCHIADHESGVIKKHENIRPEKEADRAKHISRLNAHTEPVLLIYRDTREIDTIVKAATNEKPLFDFSAADGITHTIWRLEANAPVAKAFRNVPVCYIADGHHRVAGAVRVAQEKRSACSSYTGNEEYNWFPAVLFPESQVRILPYNRCVRDLKGMTEAQFLKELNLRFKLNADASAIPQSSGHVSMYLGKKWYDLRWAGQPCAGSVSPLDVDNLQVKILKPLLGINDPRTSTRIDFVGGLQSTNKLEKLVACGNAAVAFSMYPVTTRQLMEISDAGAIMPPKSTWFDPKLRSGLLIHQF